MNGDRHSTTDRPLTAASNPVGRNTGRGPDFWTLDLRLSHTFQLNENVGLEVLGERFNLFNHLNYASVNNVVGSALSGPINPSGVVPDLPGRLKTLGFSSDAGPRRFQLGVRLTF